MFHARERRVVGSRQPFCLVLTRACIYWRGGQPDLFSNPILLNRFDHWNRRLLPRRIEPNWTRVIPLLGDRGRRTRKKDKHRKGDPFHEDQSALVAVSGSAARPDHSLADFIGLGPKPPPA